MTQHKCDMTFHDVTKSQMRRHNSPWHDTVWTRNAQRDIVLIENNPTFYDISYDITSWCHMKFHDKTKYIKMTTNIPWRDISRPDMTWHSMTWHNGHNMPSHNIMWHDMIYFMTEHNVMSSEIKQCTLKTPDSLNVTVCSNQCRWKEKTRSRKASSQRKTKKKTGNCNLENIKHFFCMVEFLFIIIHL